MLSLQSNQVDNQLAIVLERIEEIMASIQNENSGIPLQTIKTFRLSLTNVCTGSDIISWLMNHLSIKNREEAIHLAKMMACYGYIFTVPDCKLIVKDDTTYHRFQNQYLWPSAHNEITQLNYAVYLCKRMISNKNRSQLDEWELETFTKLQNNLRSRWDLIVMEAEAKYKYVFLPQLSFCLVAITMSVCCVVFCNISVIYGKILPMYCLLKNLSHSPDNRPLSHSF